jgi:hypothetical protein
VLDKPLRESNNLGLLGKQEHLPTATYIMKQCVEAMAAQQNSIMEDGMMATPL